jgi:hypothetical protein
MRPLLVIVSALLFAEGVATAQGCVILKRMGPADQITSHLYSWGIRGKQFQFVEGEMPEGIEWHGRLTDNDVRKLQDAGAKIVILEPKFTGADLAEGRKGCASRKSMKTGVRTRGTVTRQQPHSVSLTQGTSDAQVSQFQAGQSRHQEQVDHFSLALNGDIPTNDPTLEQGTHAGKWNCGGRGVVDSNLSPGPGCVRIN